MEKVIQTVNTETGEVLKSRVVLDTPKFGKYVRISDAALKLSFSLVKAGVTIGFVVDGDTNLFTADTEFKKWFIKTLEIGEPRYFQLMKELKEKKIIANTFNKEYMLNPLLFFRCVTRTRHKLIDKYGKLVYSMQDAGEFKEEMERINLEISS